MHTTFTSQISSARGSHSVSPKAVIITCLWLIVGAIVFAVLFPNTLIRFGWGMLAPIALVPVGIVIYRIRLRSTIVFGFLYGLLSYSLFNVWLITFSPVSFFIVPIIYSVYFMGVFVLLKLGQLYFGKYGFIIQSFIWVIYEYCRINGFLGYSFGVLGYAWSFYPLLIQTADIFGVWGITLYLAGTSFFIAQILNNTLGKQVFTIPFYRNSSIVYIIITLAIVGYGILAQKEYTAHPKVRIALIQHDTDPWKGGENAYRTSLNRLISLTTEAMAQEPPPDMVIWSETAFVPSIAYHLQYRYKPSYLRLINELYNFLAQYPTTEFLIGNGEGVKVINEQGKEVRENYNASLFFRGQERLEAYYKIHLVPFTEYFPYKHIFPRFYTFLENNDVHFWLHGDEYTVFEGEKVAFSTPICFESGFGLQNAKFIRAGAEILVNITNDAWSHVESNAMQHLQLAIFRAVENRRSMVRSTNSGMTGYIDVNGDIVELLPSFQQGILVQEVAVYTDTNTFYTRFGDWFIWCIVAMGVVMIFYRIRMRILSSKHT